MFDLDEVAGDNNEYTNKSSDRVRQLSNTTWLCRYPRLYKIAFENISEFKQDFNPLLEDFDMKPTLTTTKNPQANSPLEGVHQVILNMLVTKDFSNKVLDYIDPWGENLEYIAWAIRASDH